MRGTIQKKGKKWYAVVYDGVNPATGDYRRRWVQAGTRRGDAEKLLAELVKRAHRGETMVSEKLTLGQYLTERWLPVQEARLRKSSFDSYRRNIELHVVPALGKHQLDQLSPEDIDLFYAALLKGGRKKRPGEEGPAKGLAPKTVHNIHVMLNKALSDAARKGTVVRNVVALADAPSLQARKRPEIKAWDIDQLVAFIDAIAPHRMAPAFYLSVHTGMRRGEVLGVRWRDIDLDAGRVSVRQALVSVAYEMSISDVNSGYENAAPGDPLASIAAQLVDPEAEADPLAPSTSTAVGSLISPLLGFAVVSLQIRGSGCSGGDFDLFDLSTIYDGYDAVEITAAQPWAKGHKVGMVGISYSGFSQLYVGGTQPPSLAALAPMSVLSDLYVGIGYPGGIRNSGSAEAWLEGRQADAEPAPEGGQRWAQLLVEEGDESCIENQKLRLQTRDVLQIVEETEYKTAELYDRRLPADWAEDITVPVFLVGGTQDEQLGSDWLNVVERLDDNDQTWVTLYNGFHNDALAPEILTRWAEFRSLFVAEEVPEIPGEVLGLAGALYSQVGGADAPALEQTRFAGTTDYAKALATFEDDPRVRILFEFGGGDLGPRSLESREELTFDTSPPSEAEPTTWFLGDDGALVSDLGAAGSGEDSYTSDPSVRPDTNLGEGGVYDAEPAWVWEPVVDGSGLGFVTEPLTEPALIVGPGSADLTIASTDTEADLQVTVTEVRPDGEETYLSSGWLRASHRALDEDRSTAIRPVQTHVEADAEALEPDAPVDVRVPIHPFAHQLRAGSRLRVTVLAPGGDVPSWTFATSEDGSRTVTVAHGADAPSAWCCRSSPGPRSPGRSRRAAPCAASPAGRTSPQRTAADPRPTSGRGLVQPAGDGRNAPQPCGLGR